MGDPEESIRNSLTSFSTLVSFGFPFGFPYRCDPGGIHSLSLLNLRSPQALFPEKLAFVVARVTL
jgi:hypothetical protein